MPQTKDTVRQMISDYINQHQDELIKKVQEAVRIRSIIGEEQAIQTFMKQLYESIGLDVVEVQPDLDELSKHEAYVASGFPLSDRKNLVGIWQGKGQGKSLTLHGHIDVVSEEPVEMWTKNPLGGEIEGNRLYGRGAYDMKSGVIANWFAVKTLKELGIEPKGTVQLHSTIEEESGGGAGALAVLDAGYVTDGFVTTEPSDLDVCISHVGVMYFRVRVFGKTAHAARTQDGINAISKMYKVFHALEKLEEKRAKEVKFELYSKRTGGQAVNLNLGTLEAGDWVSSVPGEAVLQCRIGFIPGETRADIKALVEKTIADAVKDDDWLQQYPPEIEWFGWSTEAWYQDTQDPYVQSFLQTYEQVIGKKAEIIGATGGLDSRFTAYYGKPSLSFGVRGGNLHGPDEYVEIDSIIEVTKVLANHIVDWTES